VPYAADGALALPVLAVESAELDVVELALEPVAEQPFEPAPVAAVVVEVDFGIVLVEEQSFLSFFCFLI